jgi:glycosyltransferase involved in cell wall biosynthesis
VPAPTSQAPEFAVTVIIPVFNRRDSVADTIRSVQNQNAHGVREIIVVDDASSDDSSEVAEALGCRVVRLEVNGGSAQARNAGLALVATPWVAFVDSDDVWHEDLLATLVPSTEGRVLVSGSGLLLVDGQVVTVLGCTDDAGQELRSPADLLTPANPIVTSATIVQTDAVRELGGYDATLRYSEDFDLWIRVLERGAGWCNPRPVLTYFRGSGSKSQKSHGKVEAARVAIINHYAGRPWWSKQAADLYLGTTYWEGCRTAMRERTAAPAVRYLAKALSNPTRIRGVAMNLLRNRRLRRRAAAFVAGAGTAPGGALPS